MTDNIVSINDRIPPAPLPAEDDSDHDRFVQEHLSNVDAYLASNARQAENDRYIATAQPKLMMEDDSDHDEFVREHLRDIDSSEH